MPACLKCKVIGLIEWYVVLVIMCSFLSFIERIDISIDGCKKKIKHLSTLIQLSRGK